MIIVPYGLSSPSEIPVEPGFGARRHGLFGHEHTSEGQKTGDELGELAEKMVAESDRVKAERLKEEIIFGFYGKNMSNTQSQY